MAIGTENIQEVKNRHKGTWFDASTMQCFNSRVGETAYRTADGAMSFFVSSERYNFTTPRCYTVRVQNCETGSVTTVGEFQGYASRRAAHKEAERLSKCEGDLITSAYVRKGTLAATWPKVDTYWIDFGTLCGLELTMCLHIETEEAAERIKAELLEDRVLTDPEAAERPYGEVYRLAILPYRIKLNPWEGMS